VPHFRQHRKCACLRRAYMSCIFTPCIGLTLSGFAFSRHAIVMSSSCTAMLVLHQTSDSQHCKLLTFFGSCVEVQCIQYFLCLSCSVCGKVVGATSSESFTVICNSTSTPWLRVTRHDKDQLLLTKPARTRCSTANVQLDAQYDNLATEHRLVTDGQTHDDSLLASRG